MRLKSATDSLLEVVAFEAKLLSAMSNISFFLKAFLWFLT